MMSGPKAYLVHNTGSDKARGLPAMSRRPDTPDWVPSGVWSQSPPHDLPAIAPRRAGRKEGFLELVGAIYEIHTGRVRFLE